MKIVSGGQTGVDRAALDAALECGIDAGGWCPEGRMAEDGTIPESYPVTELPGAGYRQRTQKNVLDSDGTVIIYFGSPHGGTELTLACCRDEKKPFLLIDAEKSQVSSAAKKVEQFIAQYAIMTLNVAGPRASDETRAYSYAKRLIESALKGG